MKLLVSGCSITHGAELYNNFMSPENVKQSFSAELAKQLDLELLNVALSGGSNEYIFHSVNSALEQHNDIAHVLVVWTSTNRIYWKCNDRHYFVLPTWTSSMVDLENFIMHDKQQGEVWATGDSSQIVNTLLEAHKFFITHYFDDTEAKTKLKHYDLCLAALCRSKNIPYHSLTIYNLSKAGPGHPTRDEHKKIAEFIYNKFYKSE